jgi:hypothetical protein
MEELEYASQSIQLFNRHLKMQNVAQRTISFRTADSLLIGKYNPLGAPFSILF